MSGEQTNLMGLSSPPARLSPPASRHLAPHANRRLTKEQRRLVEECDSAMLAIDGTTILAMEAERRLAELHRYGALEFHDTLIFELTLRDQSFCEEAQLYMAEYVRVDLKGLAMNLRAIAEAAGESALREVSTPLHVERDTRGPLRRFFG